MTSWIVLESGSRWPDWVLGRCRNGTMRVIEQQETETPSELADRVADLLAREEVSGLRLGIIACNERCDEAAEGSRRTIAQALVRRLTNAGRVVLTASDRASGPSRRKLSDLARLLDALSEDSGRSVAVRFGEPAQDLAVSARVG